MAKTPEQRRIYNDLYRTKHPKRVMLNSARRRSAERGVPFDLTEDDFDIPVLCPIFQEPLRPGDLYWAPSLDRLIPSKGYVAGNVQVVSRRANLLKNDGTANELLRVALWVARETPWEPEPHD